jgi:hypothetical protein
VAELHRPSHDWLHKFSDWSESDPSVVIAARGGVALKTDSSSVFLAEPRVDKSSRFSMNSSRTRSRARLKLRSGLGGSVHERESNWGVEKVRRRHGATVSDLCSWEGGKRRINWPGRALTPRRSSCGSRATAESGRAMARRAPEARQWRRQSELGLLGFAAEATAAGWGEDLGRGRCLK